MKMLLTFQKKHKDSHLLAGKLGQLLVFVSSDFFGKDVQNAMLQGTNMSTFPAKKWGSEKQISENQIKKHAIQRGHYNTNPNNDFYKGISEFP